MFTPHDKLAKFHHEAGPVPMQNGSETMDQRIPSGIRLSNDRRGISAERLGHGDEHCGTSIGRRDRIASGAFAALLRILLAMDDLPLPATAKPPANHAA